MMRWYAKAAGLLIGVLLSSLAHGSDLYDYMGDRYSVDSVLLRAVSSAESHEYPWTVDLNGTPFFFSSKEEALTFAEMAQIRPWLVVVSYKSSSKQEERYLFPTKDDAEALRAKLDGVSSFNVKCVDSTNIDLGLMQVNWRYHGTAVPSMSRLLDPDYNVAYGAYLLSQLIHKYGNVWTAVGYYHSSDKHEQRRYVAEVKAIYEKLVR